MAAARRRRRVSLVAVVAYTVGLAGPWLANLVSTSQGLAFLRLCSYASYKHLVREDWRVQSRQNECLEMWILTRSLQNYNQVTNQLQGVPKSSWLFFQSIGTLAHKTPCIIT